MDPFTLSPESLEVWEIVRFSLPATVFLLQSFMFTEKATEDPVPAVTGEAGSTWEYQKFGTPAAVVQLEFPEVLLVKVITGLWLWISVTVKEWDVSLTSSVTVPVGCEETVKLASPF